jgi:hypothetical protein
MTIFSLENCKKSQEGHRDQLLRLPLFELSGFRSAPDTAVFTVKHGEAWWNSGENNGWNLCDICRYTVVVGAISGS